MFLIEKLIKTEEIEYSGLLYDMASLIEGMGVDDPVALADRICELMK